MREEVLAMFRSEIYSGKDPWSCDNVRALTEFAGIQARSGELAAARAAIKKSGKSISELGQDQQDSVRESVSLILAPSQ
jgi:ribosomal protein S13